MKLTNFPLWFPDMHCTQCDVGWDSDEGVTCWMCDSGSHVVVIRGIPKLFTPPRGG